jgi:hypothetical protein
MRGNFGVVDVLQASLDGLYSLNLEILSWINFFFVFEKLKEIMKI